MTINNMPQFAALVLQWFDQYGRKDLPWQIDRTPYGTWVSEIMLQQTQVATAIPYFERFMQRFPGVEALAAADIDEVLHYWSGLGYYARGRNLHKAARVIVGQHAGEIPVSMDALQALPGIGRSTAAAILAQAFAQRQAILDGNVKRVLARYFTVAGWPGDRKVSDQLWLYAEQLTPAERVADYTQAIMDLGALVCVRRQPHCDSCPVSAACKAYQQHWIEEYPSRKAKKKLPSRSVQMLILRNNKGEVLLQRRPPVGVWGGLLSFPEVAVDEEINSWCLDNIGVVSNFEKQPVVQHVFSHFRLQIHPVLAALQSLRPQVKDDADWQWFKPGVSLAGLAAPVKGLIQQFVE